MLVRVGLVCSKLFALVEKQHDHHCNAGQSWTSLFKTATSGREIAGKVSLGICTFFILLPPDNLITSFTIHNAVNLMHFSNGCELDSIGCLWQIVKVSKTSFLLTRFIQFGRFATKEKIIQLKWFCTLEFWFPEHLPLGSCYLGSVLGANSGVMSSCWCSLICLETFLSEERPPFMLFPWCN